MVANVEAQTYFGARHAVETLSQLIAFDEGNNALQIVSRYPHNDSPSKRSLRGPICRGVFEIISAIPQTALPKFRVRRRFWLS